jgi:hypothetical protein
MKKMRLIIIGVVVLILSFVGYYSFFKYSVGYKYKTISDWSKVCFDLLPEHDKGFIEKVDKTKGVSKAPIGDSPLKTPFSSENPKELLAAVDAFIMQARKSDMMHGEKWLSGKTPSFLDFTDQEYFFVEKKEIRVGSKICFIGDLHGSIHSLLRNLNRLIASGYLHDNFEIKDKNNFNMVFLGDYEDRGRYGAEVWYTLLRLKLANWDNVFLLRGNHELKFANDVVGFAYELHGYKDFKGKFCNALKNSRIDVYKKFLNLYNFLPGALFIHSGDSWVQCCHGSLDSTFDPKKFLAEQQKKYCKVGPIGGYPFSVGIIWDDFGSGNKQERRKIDRRFRVDAAYACDYMVRNNIRAIFRAHQHDLFGLKMLQLKGNIEDELLHWKKVVSREEVSNPKGFLINKHVPVFTFSSASEGVGLPYDCYGIVTTAKFFEGWRLKPYEYYLRPF